MDPEFQEWPIAFGDSGYLARCRLIGEHAVVLARQGIKVRQIMPERCPRVPEPNSTLDSACGCLRLRRWSAATASQIKRDGSATESQFR